MEPDDLIPCPDCGGKLYRPEGSDEWWCDDDPFGRGACSWSTTIYGPCDRPTWAWLATQDHAARVLLAEVTRLRADVARANLERDRLAECETDARIRLGDVYRELHADRHPRSPVAWLLRRLASRWGRR